VYKSIYILTYLFILKYKIIQPIVDYYKRKTPYTR